MFLLKRLNGSEIPMKSMLKSTVREIGQSLGRYLAILAIVMLGVGFFGGLKVTKPAMIKTLDKFLNEKNFYDYRLLSTIGFEEADLEELRTIPELTAIEGSFNVDALCSVSEGENASRESAYKIHSITDSVNQLLVTDGRMPENDRECVVDNYMAGLPIGGTVTITDNNDEDTLDLLKNHELTIVGHVRSPLYINFERGNTSIGSGKISGFIYVPKEEFDTEYLGEIYLTVSDGNTYGAYTQAYDDYIEAKTPVIEDATQKVVEERFRRILSKAQEKIEDGQKELDEKKAEALEELTKAEKEIEDAEKEIADNEKLLSDGREKLDQAKAELRTKEKDLQISEEELQKKKEELLAVKYLIPEKQYQNAYAQLELAEVQLNVGKDALEKAKRELQSRQQELDDGWEELQNAKDELEKGKKEYDEAVEEFDTKIAEAQDTLDDAKKELEDLEEPDYFVLDRKTNVGYVCYESDTNIVAAVADVFPLFFFLIAVLICMTTMNRMVEEQRTQIGIWKALGYSGSSILMKYILYAGSAALTGSVIGYVLGTMFIPQAIWQGYNIMYNMGPTIEYKSLTWVAVLSIIAALLCSVGAAYFSVIYELKEVPANLIRPKAPKSGKRIILEYIGPLWKRMKFLHKVSARNIFRYKKRFFMMVLGIGGCSALVLTGFGIGDSVKGIADLQYENIQTYDISVAFSEDASEEDRNLIQEEKAVFLEKNLDITSKEGVKTAYCIIPEDPEKLKIFLNLLDAQTGEALSYPQKGEAILSKSLADKLSVQVGDKVSISDSDMHVIEVKVSALCENYVYSYVYMNEETYEVGFGEPAYNSVWVNAPKDEDLHELAAGYMNLDGVLNVSVIADLQERISVMMGGMDFIVFVVILCAGALAFIVLYNLTNINITERIREIATIKVLGFYSGEAAQYVFRENLVLTGIGALAGLPLGKALHAFVMYNIRIDMVSFKTYISPLSYILAIALTFVFAFVVNGFMYFKLQKINMAESLKGVE